MKYNLFSAFVLLVSFSAAAQNNQGLLIQTKSLSNDAIQSVRAETSGGNIYVEGAASDPRIEVYVRSDNGRNRDMTKEEAEKILDEYYDLTITANNHQLAAIAKKKSLFKNRSHGLNISYQIYVPEAVSNDLRTSGGNIHLFRLKGKQDFGTSGGNLEVDQVIGRIDGKTSGGNIHLKNSSENIHLSTSGGNIDAENCKGNLNLSTSGGSISMEQIAGDIDASTSGGSIHGSGISGSLKTGTSGGSIALAKMACSLEASTSGGNIDVDMLTMGKYLTLRNSGGSIHLALPGKAGMALSLRGEKVEASSMSNFKGTIDKRHIEGDLNGGGIPVTVHGGSSVHLQLN